MSATTHKRQLRIEGQMQFFNCYWRENTLYGYASSKPEGAGENWEGQLWKLGRMDAHGYIHLDVPIAVE